MTPAGDLVATPARGTLLGNRGCLHDGAWRIVRRVAPASRAWVTCRLLFRGRRRRLMTPGRYTELFFLDEATALAAGHRPCGECRRPDHRRFKAAWLRANAAPDAGADPPIAAIDRVLHRDRLAPGGRARTFPARLDALPDGAFVRAPGAGGPELVWGGRLWRWTPGGYDRARPRPSGTRVAVLTPRSTLGAIRAGYVPAVHPSALGPAPSPGRRSPRPGAAPRRRETTTSIREVRS